MEIVSKEKIKLIENSNSDYSEFVINVINAYQSKKDKFQQKISSCNISVVPDFEESEDTLTINLDKIWAKPYCYTKMYNKMEHIVKQVNSANIEDLKNNTALFCKEIVKKKYRSEKYVKPEEMTDIADYIKDLNNIDLGKYDKIKFWASKIDEEAVYKKEQLETAMEIVALKNKPNQNSRIYDEICSYLDEDFLAKGYCNFKNNKCFAQRARKLYPINKTDGCCFMEIRKCNHLHEGKCEVNCIACKLFACPFLSKMGIGYYANEFPLLKAFYNSRQIRHIIFDFYKSKEEILKKLN